jgi:hypothetical protein
LIKILSRVCAGVVLLLLVLVLGALFGPAGIVLEPLAERLGSAFVPSLRIGKVDGSLYGGLALNDVELISGDKTLLAVSLLTLRPSWEELLRGNLWLSELELRGIRAETEDLSALAARYGRNEGGDGERSGVAFRPLRAEFRDIEIRAPQFSVSVNEGFLDRDGLVGLSADLNGLPVRLGGRVSFSPAALSLGASVGTGRVSLSGRLEPPFGISGDLAVKIEELLAALPGLPAAAKGAAEGELVGHFAVAGASSPGAPDSGNFRDLSAQGSLRLTGRAAAGRGGGEFSLSASAPWSYEGGVFSSRVSLESLSATLALNVSADLRPTPAADRVYVRGEALNISLGRLSRALPLGANLEGGGGRVDFWASADLAGKAAGKLFVRLPRLEADKKRLVEGLRVSVLLAPDGSVTVDGVGEVFGAKISAAGGIDGIGPGDGTKGIPELRNPEMTFTAKKLDSSLIAAAFPALAPLAPSGTADVTVRAVSRSAAGSLADRLALRAEVRSQALTLGGVRLDEVSLSARYGNGAKDGNAGAFVLESLTARIGKAPLSFSGEISPGKAGVTARSPESKNGVKGGDWSSAALRFDGGVKGLDPEKLGAVSAALGGQVQGIYDAEVSVRGTLGSPRVDAALSESAPGARSRNRARIASVPVSGAVSAAAGLRLAASYADGRVTIPETAVGVPGGSLSFRGEAELPKGGGALRLDFSGAANLDAEAFLAKRGEAAPVSGRIDGIWKVSGPLSGAEFSLLVRSDALGIVPPEPKNGSKNGAKGGIKNGIKDGIKDGGMKFEVKNLVFDAAGTVQGAEVRNLEVRSVKAEIGGGTLAGKGNLSFGRRGRFKVDMEAEGLDIRALLAQFGVAGVVGGLLDGSLTLQGTPRRPEFVVRTTSPLTIQETLVDGLTVTFTSPARGRFDMNASARMGELTLALNGRMERRSGGWNYTAETDLLDVDRLISAKMPSMKGRLGGRVKAALSGRLGASARASRPEPVDILLTLPVFEAAGARFSEVSLPIRVLGDRVTARGSGRLYGGAVSVSADVFMPDRRWNAVLNIAGLDVGQAAAPFLPQGEIVGSADVGVKLRGNYGALMMLFADGVFQMGEGYIHKVAAFELLTKGGRIDFEEVRGSFFWDGVDLRLNPGTQVTAKRGDSFYRYLSVNGPLGIPGKGLNLDFKGRFNITALNSVLGALKGAFQMMTGTLTGSGGGQLLRSAVGRMIGLQDRDFQDVTFQLKGSWSELQLLNLKIDKSLEAYLPLKSLNAEEHKENEKKIKFNLRIPVGPGGEGDGEEPGDQMKRQILDNLLNQVY